MVKLPFDRLQGEPLFIYCRVDLLVIKQLATHCVVTGLKVQILQQGNEYITVLYNEVSEGKLGTKNGRTTIW